jgi:hypothetical protein
MKKAKLSLPYLLASFILIVHFFPWISFNIIDLDLQPWFIIFGLLYILFTPDKSPRLIVFGYLFPCIVIIVSYFHNTGLERLVARSLFSYLGIVTCINFYYLFRSRYDSEYDKKNIFSLLIFSNSVWILSALLQKFFGERILEFMVTVRTSPDRGVTSLAPEPTFFGIVLLCYSLLIFLFFSYNSISFGVKHKKINPNSYILALILLNTFATLLLAESSLTFILSIFSFLVYFISINAKDLMVLLKRFALLILQPVRLFFILILVALVFLSFNIVFTESSSRFSNVIGGLIENPLYIIEKDASVNSRVSNFILPIRGAVEDLFVPHGFYSYSSHGESLAKYYEGFFWYDYAGDKIASGIASSVYELGVFSFLFMFWIAKLIWDRNRASISIASIVSIFVIMSTAVSLAFPLIGILIAELYYQKRYSRTKALMVPKTLLSRSRISL